MSSANSDNGSRGNRRSGAKPVLGVVLVIGLVIVVANFAIDLIVAWMDRRAAEAGARSAVVGRVA